MCNEAGYRAYMIEGIKTLKVLDGVPIGSERDQKPVQNIPKKSSLFDDDEEDSDFLFSNNPLSKNTKPQPTTDTPVKVHVAEDEKKIPAKTTSPVQETKVTPIATEQPTSEISPSLPKEEKPAPVQKAPEPEKPKVEEQPVKKIEEKTAKPATVAEKKPAQIEKPKDEPNPQSTQKTEEKSKEDKPATNDNTTQSTPGVFKDSRSRLEIS